MKTRSEQSISKFLLKSSIKSDANSSQIYGFTLFDCGKTQKSGIDRVWLYQRKPDLEHEGEGGVGLIIPPPSQKVMEGQTLGGF